MNGIEDFETIRKTGEAYYKSVDSVYCPYFRERIHFTAIGLEHLLFPRRGVMRLKKDQYMRFKLLSIAPVIIGESKTVQGILHTKEFQQVRKHNRIETVLQEVSYYEFLAVIDDIRTKVVVKRIADGPLVFWSIIPFWGIANAGGKRKLYSGNITED